MAKLEYTFKTDTLFKANTEEELAKIEKMDVPIMKQAIQAYHQITADSEFWEMERLRELARHDEASALRHARDEGREERTMEIARKMKNAGLPLNEIIKFTSLSEETIKQM